MRIKEAGNAYPLYWNPATPAPLPDGAEGGPGSLKSQRELSGNWVGDG